MNNTMLTLSTETKNLIIRSDGTLLPDVPYFDIDTTYEGCDLVVAFVNGSNILAVERDDVLWSLFAINEDFDECEGVKSYIFAQTLFS